MKIDRDIIDVDWAFSDGRMGVRIYDADNVEIHDVIQCNLKTGEVYRALRNPDDTLRTTEKGDETIKTIEFRPLPFRVVPNV